MIPNLNEQTIGDKHNVMEKYIQGLKPKIMELKTKHMNNCYQFNVCWRQYTTMLTNTEIKALFDSFYTITDITFHFVIHCKRQLVLHYLENLYEYK